MLFQLAARQRAGFSAWHPESCKLRQKSSNLGSPIAGTLVLCPKAGQRQVRLFGAGPLCRYGLELGLDALGSSFVDEATKLAHVDGPTFVPPLFLPSDPL